MSHNREIKKIIVI